MSMVKLAVPQSMGWALPVMEPHSTTLQGDDIQGYPLQVLQGGNMAGESSGLSHMTDDSAE